MADKMLIDATHPEETRVVVLRGNRVEEFDFESANRKQLRGNIYLAKVTRVEPSLQAAFVEYGGNRHGFLAFSEIHPDYYQIPVADRQALLEQEEHDQRAADADADNRASRRGGGRHRRRGAERHRGRGRETVKSEPIASDEQPAQEFTSEAGDIPAVDAAFGAPEPADTSEIATALPETAAPAEPAAEARDAAELPASESMNEPTPAPEAEAPQEAQAEVQAEAPHADDTTAPAEPERVIPYAEAAEQGDGNEADDEHGTNGDRAENGDNGEHAEHDDEHEDDVVESVGGADALEEVQERVPRFRKQYKIQEVIKRRQVMLVQVVKEERGTKGAALTTYLSLAGRYSVLMPNTARGGGISRKITSGEDRSRLKEIAQELEVPEGMGVILRTAGAARTKMEVKRDFEYLLRLWETVRDLTLKSMAPKLVYEEGSLIKRSIRDLYSKDIDEVIVAGEEGYKEAREFMRMLMPSHARNVKLYADSTPLFTRYGIESQLDAMFTPVVQLRSGGYIVINQTEALVAIDVNSGRATREHHIEDTALKTNCEAAEEVARQLRLRDLAGLIVIDFIDMDETRNNRTVERRMKDALKHDRARIQVGRISHFGLLEMSRQRIRTSVLESSTEKCPVCGGSGHVRSVSSVALQLLRAVEETLNKGATHNLIVRTRSEVALYVLNHKRAHLRALEERYRITITISADATVNAQVSYVVDRGEQVHTAEAAKALAAQIVSEPAPVEEEDLEVFPEEEEETIAEQREAGEPVEARGEAGLDAEGGEREAEGEERDGDLRRRRRRRGRGRGRGREGEPREARGPREPRATSEGGQPFTSETVAEHAVAHEDHDAGSPEEEGFGAGAPREEGAAGESGDVRRRRRRGRRGGRRNRTREGAPGNGQDSGQENGNENGNGFDQAEGAPQYADEAQQAPPPHMAVSDEDASAVAPRFETPVHPVHAAATPVAVSDEDASAVAPRFEAPVHPVHAAPSAAQSQAAAPERAPRRRSTIRERAPIGAESETPAPVAPVPAPTPVVSSTASEEPATPKRGWWGKRLLGGNE